MLRANARRGAGGVDGEVLVGVGVRLFEMATNLAGLRSPRARTAESGRDECVEPDEDRLWRQPTLEGRAKVLFPDLEDPFNRMIAGDATLLAAPLQQHSF